MAYIGAKPNELFRVAPTKDTFSGDGSTTTFDLANAVPAGGEFALQVFIDNVRQEPGSGKAFTLGVDGSGDMKRITFTAAPDASTAIYVLTNFDNEAFSNTDLNGQELQLDADGDTTITADTDDQIDIKIAGADDFQIVANNFKVLSGSTLTIESGATITNSGTATNFGISAADDLTAGDSAVNLTTTTGNITIDAQGGDTDIIFKGTDGSSDTTFLTLDGSEAGDATFNRAVVVGNGLTVSDGDITVASGHGINFAATSDGAGTDTSELLDDYEEGTWTPALSNFGGSNETFIAPRYTKIGRLVTVSCQLQIGSFPSDGSTFALSGLPYTCKNDGGTTFGTVPFRQTNTNIMGLTIGDNNTVMEMYGLDDGGGQFNYNDFGQSKQMAFVAQYETD